LQTLPPFPTRRSSDLNSVTVLVNRLDFGQGIATTLPMLVAEELDADWSKVRGELAPAGDAYKDPGFGIQMTGGSSATPHSWQQRSEEHTSELQSRGHL